MKVLVIDNYDSFVFNLVHYLEDLGCEVVVKRNDEISLTEVADFHKILLSPGPGIPDEAGLMKVIIEKYAPSKSILGVCLGQQAIGEVFGGTLMNLPKVFHGVTSEVTVIEEDLLFKNMPKQFTVGRYHSWAVSSVSDSLSVTSVDENGYIMSLRHKEYDIRGVQYHPESILTPFGKTILKNWIEN